MKVILAQIVVYSVDVRAASDGQARMAVVEKLPACGSSLKNLIDAFGNEIRVAEWGSPKIVKVED